MKKAICGLTLAPLVLANFPNAQLQIDDEVGEQIIFILYTDQTRGQILYQPTFEDRKGLLRTMDALDDPTGEVFTSEDAMNESEGQIIASNLRRPTYLTYDFVLEKLYVCDFWAKAIYAYPVEFKGTREIVLGDKLEVYDNISCGGLKTDKFGNLYFVDTANHWIGKIKHTVLEEWFKENEKEGDYKNVEDLRKQVINLYNGTTDPAARNPLALEIEREYLYWTNRQVDDQENVHGAIHKAFTEPFIVAAPFRTYEVQQVKKAHSIAANEHFLFFTGIEFEDLKIDQLSQTLAPYLDDFEEPYLFVQKKGTNFIYKYSDKTGESPLYDVQGVLNFRDKLLLVSHGHTISQIDLRTFNYKIGETQPFLRYHALDIASPTVGMTLVAKDKYTVRPVKYIVKEDSFATALTVAAFSAIIGSALF